MRGVILDADSLGKDMDLTPITDRFSEIEVYGSTLPRELASRIAQVEVILTNKIRLERADLEQSQKLKLISVMATGTNNIDLEYCAKNNIAVCNAQGYSTASVVQHTIGLMLALSTNMIDYHGDVRAGKWQQSKVFCLLDHPIQELAGKKLGILGYGELGRTVASIARAFGMEVLVSRRPGSDSPKQSGIDRIEWNELTPQVDYLSLHCPLTPDNEDIVNAAVLKSMKPTSFLINTARGGLVNSQDLITSLRSGQIGGAAIDVLNQEPARQDEPLLTGDIPHLIVTPHNAWAARESRQRLIIQMKENILAYTRNEFPRNVLPS